MHACLLRTMRAVKPGKGLSQVALSHLLLNKFTQDDDLTFSSALTVLAADLARHGSTADSFTKGALSNGAWRHGQPTSHSNELMSLLDQAFGDPPIFCHLVIPTTAWRNYSTFLCAV